MKDRTQETAYRPPPAIHLSELHLQRGTFGRRLRPGFEHVKDESRRLGSKETCPLPFE